MLKAGDTLDFRPVLDMKFTVVKSASETDGESFEMEWELGPKLGGTPPHIHPDAEESYRVLAGSLEVLVGSEWRTLREGETAAVPPNATHTFRNPLDEPTRIYNVHRPAQQFEAFFSDLHRLVHSGKVDPEMGLGTVMRLSMLWTAYDEEIRSSQPPAVVMKVLAFIGRLLGLEPQFRRPGV